MVKRGIIIKKPKVRLHHKISHAHRRKKIILTKHKVKFFEKSTHNTIERIGGIRSFYPTKPNLIPIAKPPVNPPKIKIPHKISNKILHAFHKTPNKTFHKTPDKFKQKINKIYNKIPPIISPKITPKITSISPKITPKLYLPELKITPKTHNKKLFIILGIVIIIIIAGIFLYNYLSHSQIIKYGDNIERVVITNDGKNAYIKLLEGVNNITGIKFIFKDKNGKEYDYETSEGSMEISIPYKKDWWNFFIKPKSSGTYDFIISVDNLGVNNLKEISEVSASFIYNTIVVKEIITTPANTTKSTKPKLTIPSSGGGGGSGGGGEPPAPCSPNCAGKVCGDDGCGGVCGPGCSAGQDCDVNGICVNKNCIDSDGGINYLIKGNLSYKNQSGIYFNFTDYCYPSNNNITYNYTLEYYCTNTSYSSNWYNCPFGCLDGVCKVVNGSICNNQCTAGQKKCDYNYYVYSCTDSNYDGCLEWTYSQYCYAGCSNGACINAPCNDTDNGINYSVKGSVVFGNNTIATDICYNKNLYEYYCINSTTYNFNYTTCPINCLDGACVSSCTPGNVCRATAGICDIPEYYDNNCICPSDSFNSSSNICRSAIGFCDLTENCTGTSAICPIDSNKTNGANCTMGLPALSPFLSFLKLFGIDFGIMGTGVCQGGVCTDIRCNNNIDCGTNGFTGNPFCQGGNVYRNYTTYTCNSPRTTSSSCSNSTTSLLNQTCTSGCSNGICINSCTYTPWINQGCGNNICPLNQMYQNRTVLTGTGCTDTSQCITNDTCSFIVSNAVSWWRMDDISGNIIIDRLGRNNGTNYGAVQVNDRLGTGKAMDFNGINNYLSIPFSSSLNLTDNFTISAWIYPKKITNPFSSMFSRFSSLVNTSGTYYFNSRFLVSANGQLYFQKGNISGNINTVGGNPQVSSLKWTHVLMTKRGANITFYVNGTLDKSVLLSDNTMQSRNSDNWYIGYERVGSAFSNNSIDDVMIFNKTLNQTEISKLYNSP